MARPLDTVTAFHNAFRRDIARVDQAALQWGREGGPAVSADLARYRFLNEALVWHAAGEEAVVFPFLEQEAPRLSEPYIRDHHGLDDAYERIDAAVRAGDALEAARAAAALKFHLDLHLAKEDTQVYPLIRERIHLPEEQAMAGAISGMVPRERFPEVIGWLFPLLGDTDRENVVDVFRTVLPPEVFVGVSGLIRQALGQEWAAFAAKTGLPS